MFRHFLLLFAVFVWTVPTANAQPADSASPMLDCTFRTGNGLYAPQQSIVLDTIFRPQSPNTSPSKLHATLTDLSSPDRRVIAEINTQIPPSTPLPIPFVTPEKEGVYEILLSVELATFQVPLTNHHFQRVSRSPTLPVVEVRRQFVVLNPQGSPRSTGDWILSDTRDLLTAATADFPPRRQLFALPKMGDLPKISDLPRPANLLKHSPFGRTSPYRFPGLTESLTRFPGKGHVWLPDSQGQVLDKSEQHPGFSVLPPAGVDGYTWHSMPMDTEVGKPYLVEIDYPGDIPQTLGIGVVSPLHVDGTSREVITAAVIHVAEEIVQDTHTETTATHQLLFWATAKSHELVLINHQPDKESLFRNIRISQVTTQRQDDQRLPKLFEGTAQRKRIGQLLGETGFHRTISHTAVAGASTDWQQSYERASHLIDTLCRGGYDGLAMTVIAGNLYPHPEENGFFDRKSEAAEWIEMLFQRFDKEELTLIPAIEFDMPIPSLERLVSQHPGITEEIRGGSQYNLLHPAVQQAMAEMVLELVDHFGQHPSFGGVALVLSPGTYTQLPFALYPPDDYTFAQFRQETEGGLDIPFPDEQHLRQTMPTQQFLEQKNAGRIQFLQSNPNVWETWVRWRAAKISGFYADLASQVSSRRSDAPLYLLGGTMFDSPEIQEYCRPTLPRNFAPVLATQLLGFDLPLISKTESLHFLKPVQIAEKKNYTYEGLNSADTVAHFSKADIMPGVQFVHTDTDHFVTTPAHMQSRKRFVQQFAQTDVFMFMDGGVSLPFGQESEMLDMLDTYRRLPPVPFQTFQPSADHSPSLQPLTVRYKSMPDGMIVYIVNDAPFTVEADIVFTADLRSTMAELTGHRMIRPPNRGQHSGSHTWQASLLPYDLLAIRISDANTKIESVVVHCPPSVCGAEGAFKQKVDELTRRIHEARKGVPLEGLVNTGFELPLDAEGQITGWQCFGKSFTAQLDQVAVCKGQSSVKLTNNPQKPGTEHSAVLVQEPGMFLSQPMPIPDTGRLGVSMFVGVSANCQSLPMNVVLYAKHRDKPFYRGMPVEKTLMPRLMNVQPKNGVRWHQLVTTFERLPLESLEEVRIGIQYSGSGTVWLDDIMVYHVLFSADEINELLKLLVVADQRCVLGKVSDLTSQLEDYWTQFLFQHVPAPIPQVAISSPSVAKEVVEPPKSPTWYQRAKGWVGL